MESKSSALKIQGLVPGHGEDPGTSQNLREPRQPDRDAELLEKVRDVGDRYADVYADMPSDRFEH